MAKRSSAVRRDFTLSPIALRVLKLAELLGRGSQRSFAAQVGCSQALLSKIANGQQEPGRQLLAQIAALQEVNSQWLKEGVGEPLSSELPIPIAEALLPGPPAQYPHLLTSRSEAVKAGSFRPTLYGVEARNCQPAFSNPDERLFTDDLMVVDSAVDRWEHNLQVLDGKLCVIKAGVQEIRMQRVWLSPDSKDGSRALVTWKDSKLTERRRIVEEMERDRERFGRFVRIIEMRPAEQIPPEEDIAQEIPVSAVVGLVTQVLRTP